VHDVWNGSVLVESAGGRADARLAIEHGTDGGFPGRDAGPIGVRQASRESIVL